MDFAREFKKLTTFDPLRWQTRLFTEHFSLGALPASVDIPTGLGKTSVMAIWYLALVAGARLPRRLVYVVDRRAVVDQATTVAEEIKKRSSDGRLRVSTLRGQLADHGGWLEDPSAPSIIVGTVDMIGSRLLFSGYGVSRKMRPYHAAFLGSDTLVVLDESHLVPPFERLLDAIDAGTNFFGPRDEFCRKIVPPFKLLSLSATGRARDGTIFRLEEKKGDLDDEVVKERLQASKRVTVNPADEGELAEILAGQAWALSGQGRSPVRILVYCDRRSVSEKTKRAIEDYAEGDKRSGVSSVPVDIELFVGARRVAERVKAADRLKSLGFLAGSDVKRDKPAFLIATSAGEVGVDLDADHMVCDLVPWERMVQRLGRVNRLGKGSAQIVLVHEGEKQPRKPDEPTQEEIRARIAQRALKVLDCLPKESGIDVSPGAIRKLKSCAETDTKLREEIHAATTPLPLYPALTRALVDAWSMTSLEKHTGRPEVAPWLRGWVDEEPQTVLVWRKYVPVRVGGAGVSEKEVEEFFEAAPPHLSEKLETESWRVADWITKRAVAWKKQEPEAQGFVVFVLEADGVLRRRYDLDDLISIQKNKDRERRLTSELVGTTVVLDMRLGGLSDDGLLNESADASGVRTADGGGGWPVDVGFWIRPSTTGESAESAQRVAYEFATRRSAEGEALERLLIGTDKTEESRAESSFAQFLDEHQSWAERHARRIAQEVGLTGDYAETLAIAARLHDEGKKARRWQLAFNAPMDGVYAKTRGPFFSARLGGYRHEFGSLPHAERDEAFKRLPTELQDLVMHLIAAHHGRARPVIEFEGCEDAPPSLLENRARDVALRFARLQKRWGPWGLAWWEALLRAADQQASRENDQRGTSDGDR